jgi:hypothetical protein
LFAAITKASLLASLSTVVGLLSLCLLTGHHGYAQGVPASYSQEKAARQAKIDNFAAKLLIDKRSLAELQIEEQDLMADIGAVFDQYADPEPTLTERLESLSAAEQLDLTVAVLLLQRNRRKQVEQLLQVEKESLNWSAVDDELRQDYHALLESRQHSNRLAALFEALTAGQEITLVSDELQTDQLQRAFGLMFGATVVGAVQAMHFTGTRGNEIRAQRMMEANINAVDRVGAPLGFLGSAEQVGLVEHRIEALRRLQNFWQENLALALQRQDISATAFTEARRSFLRLETFSEYRGAAPAVAEVLSLVGETTPMGVVEHLIDGGVVRGIHLGEVANRQLDLIDSVMALD